MINVKQNGQVYQITFPYDPNIVNLIKAVPGRTWVPSAKMWTIPLDRLGMFLNQLRGTKYESICEIKTSEKIGINDTIESTKSIPNIDLSKVKKYVKSGFELYPHQLDFMKYSIDRMNHGLRGGFILADDPGLGKTLEGTNLAMLMKQNFGYKHCLVICCVNTSKYNWKNDINEHTNGEEMPYILGTRLKRNGQERFVGSSEDKLQDLITGHMYGNRSSEKLPYFIITNIESLRYRDGKRYPITEAIVAMVNANRLQMIIVDEVHKNTSPQSKQGKNLLAIKKKTGTSVTWLPMTGTPLVNKPVDVYTPLKLVDGHAFNSYYAWCQHFCVYGGFGGYDILGYKNIPELKRILQANMLRRLKSEVLDLPPKIYNVRYVENTKYQDRLYKSVLENIRLNKNQILSTLNPLSKLIRLRQVNGSPEIIDKELIVDVNYLKQNAKLQELLVLLEEIAERGEKTLIYSNWVEPLRTVYKFLAKRYKVCCFTGTMSEEDRNKNKHVFMTNPNYTVMIGTIGAMGTTHTLTAAQNVIFYDEPWTPSDKLQAEDRAYRIGTKDSINIYTIITQDTIDERVHNIIYTKDSMSKFIVDDNLDLHNHPELFDVLLDI